MLDLKFLFIFWTTLNDEQSKLVGMIILGAILLACVANAVASTIYNKNDKS